MCLSENVVPSHTHIPKKKHPVYHGLMSFISLSKLTTSHSQRGPLNQNNGEVANKHWDTGVFGVPVELRIHSWMALKDNPSIIAKVNKNHS